jgi:hypothetical protein
MTGLLVIVLVVLIVAALFLLESEIGFQNLMKSLVIIIIAIASGIVIYYCVDQLHAACGDVPQQHQQRQHAPSYIKHKWGGVGIPDGDPESSRLGTDYDIDVQAFHKGMDVYGDLRNDTSGDAMLAARSQFQSQKNEQAVINRSKYTVDSIKKYFEDELHANEKKNWLDDDELDAYV